MLRQFTRLRFTSAPPGTTPCIRTRYAPHFTFTLTAHLFSGLTCLDILGHTSLFCVYIRLRFFITCLHRFCGHMGSGSLVCLDARSGYVCHVARFSPSWLHIFCRIFLYLSPFRFALCVHCCFCLFHCTRFGLYTFTFSDACTTSSRSVRRTHALFTVFWTGPAPQFVFTGCRILHTVLGLDTCCTRFGLSRHSGFVHARFFSGQTTCQVPSSRFGLLHCSHVSFPHFFGLPGPPLLFGFLQVFTHWDSAYSLALWFRSTTTGLLPGGSACRFHLYLLLTLVLGSTRSYFHFWTRLRHTGFVHTWTLSFLVHCITHCTDSLRRSCTLPDTACCAFYMPGLLRAPSAFYVHLYATPAFPPGHTFIWTTHVGLGRSFLHTFFPWTTLPSRPLPDFLSSFRGPGFFAHTRTHSTDSHLVYVRFHGYVIPRLRRQFLTDDLPHVRASFGSSHRNSRCEPPATCGFLPFTYHFSLVYHPLCGSFTVAVSFRSFVCCTPHHCVALHHRYVLFIAWTPDCGRLHFGARSSHTHWTR